MKEDNTVTLLQIHEFITKMQRLIGNNAKVNILAKEDVLIIRVEWAENKLIITDMISAIDNGYWLDSFINFCRRSYEKRGKDEIRS